MAKENAKSEGNYLSFKDVLTILGEGIVNSNDTKEVRQIKNLIVERLFQKHRSLTTVRQRIDGKTKKLPFYVVSELLDILQFYDRCINNPKMINRLKKVLTSIAEA